MDDAVSDALNARTAADEGLAKMLLASVAAHVVLVMLAALAPASLWQRPIDARSAIVTIDLGPSHGDDSGGHTSIGVRQAPRVTTKLPLPPLARASDDERARKPVAVAADSSEARADTTAVAASAAQPGAMGLSTSIGGGNGAPIDIGDFCCSEYIAIMIQRIRQHWTPGRGANAGPVMQFTIQRDGAIADVRRVRSSGNQMHDFLAERALLAVRQLPPLPDAYTNPSLIVSLDFQHQP